MKVSCCSSVDQNIFEKKKKILLLIKEEVFMIYWIISWILLASFESIVFLAEMVAVFVWGEKYWIVDFPSYGKPEFGWNVIDSAAEGEFG